MIRLEHMDTLEKNTYFFLHLTQITELREHKTLNELLQTDSDDKLDDEFHQLRGFMIRVSHSTRKLKMS